MSNVKQKLSSLFLFLSIVLFIIAFNFSDNPTGNWYQQFLPSPLGGQLKDIYFVDSLLGFAVSDSSIFKTTNGGDNWSLKLNGYYIFQRVRFINSNTGFACAGNNKLLKSTNSGDNWNLITLPIDLFPYDMAVLNEDTIWLVDKEALTGGVYRTTNGGATWTHQLNVGGNNPDHIYMYNKNIGFISQAGFSGRFYKTSNSGMNWTPLSDNGFYDMYFADSLTGWKCVGSMKKTTDGGFNWVTQTLPSGGNIITTGISKFSNVSRDTIWGVGGYVQYPNFQIRGMIYRTTNGGGNWLFQIPDTSIHIGLYRYIKFISRLNGWAYSSSPGVHTVTGGDTTFYTEVKQISNEIPKEFVLRQNYPNPFNPKTVISYQLVVNGHIKLIVFDIQGKEAITLVNQKQNAGTYEVEWSAGEYSSGVYYYVLSSGSYLETKKMILLK